MASHKDSDSLSDKQEHQRQPQHDDNDVIISPATIEDADTIKQMVRAAYTKYIERIGKEPAPMADDYHALIAGQAQDVYVLLRRREGNQDDDGGRGAVVGSILLSDSPLDDSLKVNNLLVAPSAQGRGYGRLLMGFAEETARAQGRPALTLFTNEKMYENLALYPRMGFLEVDRRVEDGYRRVYFRKSLAPAVP